MADVSVILTIGHGRIIVLAGDRATHIGVRTDSRSAAMLSGDSAGHRLIDALCAATGYYPEDPAVIVARDRVRELQAERIAALADDAPTAADHAEFHDWDRSDPADPDGGA